LAASIPYLRTTDIFECFGTRPNQFHYGAISKNKTFGGGAWADVPASTQDSYHTYGVMWTPATIDFYFDDYQVASIITPPDMHYPMYLIANLAVGGIVLLLVFSPLLAIRR